MKKLLLLTLSIGLLFLNVQSQESALEIPHKDINHFEGQIPSTSYFHPVILSSHECISDETRLEVRQNIAANKENILLNYPDAFSTNRSGGHPLFVLPIKAKDGFDEYGYYTLNFQVDHNLTPNNNLLDYNCGARTYDWGSGNHKGTDYILWPYPWKSMDEEIMEIIAAADGIIVDKRDGNFDLNCANNGNPNWNGVVLEHADGSQTWYWHFKNGAITSKNIGESVVAGEYLGAAGSSGSSDWPHLHFEVYDNNENLIDPYEGTCNTMNPNSWWLSQQDYFVPGINRLSTHKTNQFDEACPEIENTYEALDFFHGDDLFIRVFYRDIQEGTVTSFTILDPDNQVFANWDWAQNWGQDYATAHALWPLSVNGSWPDGVYTLQVNFGGNVYESIFGVNTNLSNESNNFTEISLYPNPVSDILNIEATNQMDEIVIYDIKGSIVLVTNLEKVNAKLNLEMLKSGVYFVHIESQGKMSIYKIIKK